LDENLKPKSPPTGGPSAHASFAARAAASCRAPAPVRLHPAFDRDALHAAAPPFTTVQKMCTAASLLTAHGRQCGPLPLSRSRLVFAAAAWSGHRSPCSSLAVFLTLMITSGGNEEPYLFLQRVIRKRRPQGKRTRVRLWFPTAEASPGKKFFCKNIFTQRLPPLWAEPFLDRFLGEGP
jgi:hypothetical protein